MYAGVGYFLGAGLPDPVVGFLLRVLHLSCSASHSILREYVDQLRPKPTPYAFMSMEPIAGEH
jgi:hypothetical protein